MHERITAELRRELPTLQTRAVAAVLALLDEGATVPFIARYRKERTGGLDEVAIRHIEALRGTLVELDKRRSAIVETLAGDGVLTPELVLWVHDDMANALPFARTLAEAVLVAAAAAERDDHEGACSSAAVAWALERLCDATLAERWRRAGAAKEPRVRLLLAQRHDVGWAWVLAGDLAGRRGGRRALPRAHLRQP